MITVTHTLFLHPQKGLYMSNWLTVVTSKIVYILRFGLFKERLNTGKKYRHLLLAICNAKLLACVAYSI